MIADYDALTSLYYCNLGLLAFSIHKHMWQQLSKQLLTQQLAKQMLCRTIRKCTWALSEVFRLFDHVAIMPCSRPTMWLYGVNVYITMRKMTFVAAQGYIECLISENWNYMWVRNWNDRFVIRWLQLPPKNELKRPNAAQVSRLRYTHTTLQSSAPNWDQGL